MGWRYLYITLGGLCLIMSFIRALVLKSRESPRWLVSCGRFAEAVDTLNKISSINGSDYTLAADHFNQAPQQDIQQTRSLRENARRTTALFASNPRLMACLVFLWILIGIAYVSNTPVIMGFLSKKSNNSLNYFVYLQLSALHYIPTILPRGQRRRNRRVEHLHHLPGLDRLLHCGDLWSAGEHVHGLNPVAAVSDLHGHHCCGLRGILRRLHNCQDNGPEPRFLIHDQLFAQRSLRSNILVSFPIILGRI